MRMRAVFAVANLFVSFGWTYSFLIISRAQIKLGVYATLTNLQNH